MKKHLKNEHQTYEDKDTLYDLYGVVNHSGTLSFGHYTAQCFNEAEGKWFNYDDSYVSEIKPGGYYTGAGMEQLQMDERFLTSEIVTPRAYLLFYKRRGFRIDSKDEYESIKT